MLAGALAYLGAFAWLETRHGAPAWTQHGGVIGPMLALAAASWLVRYGRWHWLLRRAGHALAPVRGLLAYLAGFAFTATPGKAGELVRVRYFSRLGVPPATVLAAFVFERACDLVAVLLLAMGAAQPGPLLRTGLLFVAAVLAVVLLLALRPALWRWPLARLRRWRWRRVLRVALVLRAGLAGCRRWFTMADVLVCLGLGVAAWTLTALALTTVLEALGGSLPLLQALAAYPLAMLVGAASMLPGGIGPTEAALVVVLTRAGLALPAAASAALAVRLATLWFAVATGAAALAWLEWRQARSTT
jgi:uncharacterized membrane protein YbhN (UPF0104 family)